MGFLKPKVPKPPPPPNPEMPANAADAVEPPVGADSISSLITSGARGLKRRATTQRTSLIGG